jgi:endo-1,4-beta-xylanase
MMDSIKSLKQVYKDYFPIGAAVNLSTINTHKALLIEQFNSITAENEMKFESVHPMEERYTFERSDKIAAFASDNGMRLRGHTLVWHSQTPEWVFADKNGNTISREQLLERMKDHIITVMRWYAGKTYCWDVVNEAIDDSPDVFLRNSRWLEIIGEDYIEKAFIYAHEADPDVILFYNDYNDCRENKRHKIYKLVKELKEKGVPVHGIGLQGHWELAHPSADELRTAIDKYADLGLQLQITELDVSVRTGNEELEEPTQEMLEKQAQLYENAFNIFREYKGIITGVTFWGVSDETSWLKNFPVKNRKNWPLLFDSEMKPKSAFYKVIEI